MSKTSLGNPVAISSINIVSQQSKEVNMKEKGETIMSKMNLIEAIKLNRNVSAVLSTVSYDALKKAVLDNDEGFFTNLKGIGPKTAKYIVENAKHFIVEKHKKCKVRFYTAPMYTIMNALDPVQKDLLDKAMKAKDVHETNVHLEALKGSVRDDHGVVRFYGEPTYNALPESALSDLLGIQTDTITNKICIFNFRASTDIIPNDLKDKMNDKQLFWFTATFNELERLIIKRAVRHGFSVDDDTGYTFFTCSTGQLKKEAGYWIENSEFKRNQNAFWGGLTPEEININTSFLTVTYDSDGNKQYDWHVEKGSGIVMTKILQYRALLTSASIPSSRVLGKPIRLRNLICIKEFEKNMTDVVMSVSHDYKVRSGLRTDIANNFSDGCVLFLAERVGLIVAQIRAFGFKGAGGAIKMLEFCKAKGYDQNPDCYLVEDVDGVVHDLMKETNIYGIANTSVFKMLKMFGSWKHYVENMEELGLDEVRFCAIAEEEEENKHLSRQMMQTLFDFNRNEIEYLASDTMVRLNKYNDLDYAIDVMSEAHRKYSSRTNLAKAMSAYPELITQSFVQKELRDRYTSQYNALMSGELDVNGCYHFVLPDLVALADIIFGKRAIDDPTIGWLKAGECYCDTYADAKNLILLRNPHAFMEWVIAQCAKANEFVSPHAVYTSVHDLNFRVLQMDYDGDHLLTVWDEKLAELVLKMKNRFNIPTLYYEPSKAPKAPWIPMCNDYDAKKKVRVKRSNEEVKEIFSDRICECIQKCKDFNKVGEYSNYITAAWSTYYPGMPKDEFDKLIKEVAVIASAVNHAVDAQKTYELVLLKDAAKELVEKYKTKPHSERFHRANPKKPNNDARWDKELLPIADGVVDRLYGIASDFVDSELNLDTSSLKFNWRMFQRRESEYNIKSCQAIVAPELLNSVKRIFDSNNERDRKTISMIQNGEYIPFMEFVSLLKFLNNAFFDNYREMEEDKVDIKMTQEQRTMIIRDMIVEFVRTGKAADKVAHMNNEQLLITVANSVLKEVFSSRKYQTGAWDLRRFIFDTFGDLYAEAARINIAEDFVPDCEEEDVPAFDPYAVDYTFMPPRDEDFDAMLSSELNDVF